jgi:hypothetical protein
MNEEILIGDLAKEFERCILLKTDENDKTLHPDDIADIS